MPGNEEKKIIDNLQSKKYGEEMFLVWFINISPIFLILSKIPASQSN